jgi:hypothetical protein
MQSAKRRMRIRRPRQKEPHLPHRQLNTRFQSILRQWKILRTNVSIPADVSFVGAALDTKSDLRASPWTWRCSPPCLALAHSEQKRRVPPPIVESLLHGYRTECRPGDGEAANARRAPRPPPESNVAHEIHSWALAVRHRNAKPRGRFWLRRYLPSPICRPTCSYCPAYRGHKAVHLQNRRTQRSNSSSLQSPD